MFRRNFRARLIAGAILWISIGLCVSGFILAAILRGIIVSEFDHDLSDHSEELAGLIEINSSHKPSLKGHVSDPRFVPARSGLYWQVLLRDGATLRSPSLEELSLPRGPDSGGSQPTVVDGPTGPMRMIRKVVQPTSLQEPVEIRMGVDEHLINEEMSGLHRALAASLTIIAIGLIAAAWAQIAYGLRPLARIRQAVVAVRSGKEKRLPDDLPTEVQPLVNELNGMIAANLSMVERARVLAGNFAHALKLPLAILREEARELEAQGHRKAAKVLFEQCSRMNLLVDYQTARARASALANAGASSAPAEIIQNVINAYSRLHHDSGKNFVFNGSAGIIVACDPNDLTEMVGNLIDNAAKWSRERVVVSLTDLGDKAQILVEDDGPGIPAEHRLTVFGVGVRLDEKIPGTGLGLAITHDLASLYGSRLQIEDSRYGGAAVKLALNKIMAVD